MKRVNLLLILSIFLISCNGKKTSNEKILELTNGKIVKIIFEEKEIRTDEKILVINYQIDERILKEDIVNQQVLEIWKKLENLADERGLTEGLISSKYFVGKDEKGEPIYEAFLFESEKIENGTWKIRKVN